MNFELQAMTPEGERYVELTEKHAVDFATRAEEHDRDGTFPVENFAAMKESGAIAATVPVEFGGLGVRSIHDLMVGTGRLARGCPSTAIAANMHIGGVWSFAWMLDTARQAQDPNVELMESLFPACGSGEIIMCGASTEAGTSLLSPATTATPVDGGYVLNGRKIFGTNSEVATAFAALVRVPSDDGDRVAGAFVTADTEGLEVRRTWDALGMRASCSHDIVFTECFVPEVFVFPGPPVSQWSADFLPGLISVNFPLIGAYIGIAERARDIAIDAAGASKGGRPRSDVPGIRHLVAEIEVELGAARAALSRTAVSIDDYFTSHRPSEVRQVDLEHLVKDWQCSKLIVIRSAREVVEKAMSVAGGASYMTGHSLSRLWRDVKAGSFHQPFSPVEAHEFIGRMTLGLDPLEGVA